MALIQSRRPHYVEQNTTKLVVKVKTWALGTTQPSSYQYSTYKNSFDPLVSEDLRINIVPFINDYYAHAWRNTPSSINLADNITLNVKVEVNGAVETHTAQYGFAYDVPNQYLGSNMGISISLPSDGSVVPTAYISFASTSTANLVYTSNTGYQAILPVPSASGRRVFEAPFIAPSMDITDLKSVEVKAVDSGNNELWKVKFYVDCPYQTDAAIGFINRWGVWEFFFIQGNRDFIYTNTNSGTYTSFLDGNEKDYNKNLGGTITVNTGWVPDNFRIQLQDLMVSESIVYYTGGGVSFDVTLLTKSIKRLTSPSTKMKQYKLSFKDATKLIPIV